MIPVLTAQNEPYTRRVVFVQEKMAGFRRQFPHAEERGVGVCTRERCTQPFLLAANVHPSDAATQDENWSPVLQEVPLDCPLLPGLQFGCLPRGTNVAICQCILSHAK